METFLINLMILYKPLRLKLNSSVILDQRRLDTALLEGRCPQFAIIRSHNLASSISSKVGDVGGNKSCPDSPGRSSVAAISPLAPKRRVMTGDHVSLQCSTLEYLM